MATKKELLQAQAFSRRRLLTAFVAGAPGGRELEPSSPLRGVIAGTVIAVLVIGVSFVVGLFNRGLPSGWDDGSLVLVTDSGTRYITSNGELIPITNVASARLVLPPDAPVIRASADDLEGVTRREEVGILGAPDAIPDTGTLIADGWQACLAEGGAVATTLETVPEPEPEPVALAETATLVRVASTDDLVLVQGSTRHLVPDTRERQGILRALGFVPEDAVEASAQWLALFTEGDPVQPFEIDGSGDAVPGALASVPGISVGSVVQPTGNTWTYLVTADGEFARLTPFAQTIYQLGPGEERAVVPVSAAQVASVGEVGPEVSPVPQEWPEGVVSSELGIPCALLDTAAFRTTLTMQPFPADDNSSAEEPEPMSAGVWVSPGAGALARFSGGPDNDGGVVRLIDENGTAYPVTADGEVPMPETLSRLLGSDPVPIPVPVPYAWGELFTSGPELSVEAAGSPTHPEPEVP
ncbi:MAG: type VII secretion protein EccB [Beutenbergiaceae bacterium]